MGKKLSEADKKYIKQMDRWASNIKDNISSYENDIEMMTNTIKRDQIIIACDKESLVDDLPIYNKWRKGKGLNPLKKFKYVRA